MIVSFSICSLSTVGVSDSRTIEKKQDLEFMEVSPDGVGSFFQEQISTEYFSSNNHCLTTAESVFYDTISTPLDSDDSNLNLWTQLKNIAKKGSYTFSNNFILIVFILI
jgi:hypothetical protein